MEKGIDFDLIMRHKTHDFNGLKGGQVVEVSEDRKREMKELYERSVAKSQKKYEKKYSGLDYFKKQDVVEDAMNSVSKKLSVVRNNDIIADKATRVVSGGLQVMKMFLNSTMNFVHNSQLSGFDGYYEMNDSFSDVENMASDSEDNKTIGSFIAKICENRAIKALGREQGKFEAIQANESKIRKDIPFDMGELRGIGFDDDDIME